MENVTLGIFSKPRAQISNSFLGKSTVQWPLESTRYTKPQNLQIAKNTKHSKKTVQLSKGPGGSTRSPNSVNES
ncbi:hypothetical protein H5410_032884 [Solanum commersonii]|uniref:Uncharacterized protein n=1 Tax=Solanum commersonii TaxID=4109 RepID=A0A9J5YM52_SOLCO|nr:hypothetical protein H5410_032884 [Solanum commersonii]